MPTWFVNSLFGSILAVAVWLGSDILRHVQQDIADGEVRVETLRSIIDQMRVVQSAGAERVGRLERDVQEMEKRVEHMVQQHYRIEKWYIEQQRPGEQQLWGSRYGREE